MNIENNPKFEKMLKMWRMLVPNSMESYLLDASYKVTAQESVHEKASFLSVFLLMETSIDPTARVPYKNQYQRLFQNIVANYLKEILEEGTQVEFQLLGTFLKMIRDSGLSVSPPHGYSEWKIRWQKSMAESAQPTDLFTRACAIVLAQSLTKIEREVKVDFLQQVCFLSLEQNFLNRQFIHTLFQLVFPDSRELFQLFGENVLQSDLFLDKEIVYQKSSLLWMTMVFPEVIGAELSRSLMHEFLSQPLFSLYQIALDRGLSELAFVLHDMVIDTVVDNQFSTDDFKRLNEDVEIPLANYIRVRKENEFGRKCKEIINPVQVKIGFVMDNIRLHSPFKALYSLLKKLTEMNLSEFSIHIFDMNINRMSDGNQINELIGLGVSYHNFYESCPTSQASIFQSQVELMQRFRTSIIENEMDVLIVPSSRTVSNVLLSTRTAPCQIYWSHGNFEYDIPEIDAKIVHWIASKPGFRDFSIIRSQSFLNPPVDPELVREIRRRWPENTVIMGTIGRLAKLEPDYIEAVGRILADNPNTVYLACGRGEPSKIKDGFSAMGVSDRCEFVGHVNPHVYGRIIDVVLDTFPQHGGEAITEFIAKGKPVIRRWDNFNPDNKATILSLFTESGFDSQEIPIVSSWEDYIRIARLYIASKELRDNAANVYWKIETTFMEKKSEQFYMIIRDLIKT